MDFSGDEEILQDFLIESGEIIEQLSEQLVELEKSPEDQDLLNAVFRGFHTVKGGAGFLALTPLVDICHITESLFDKLRSGQLKLTPCLMDAVLCAVDCLHSMFDKVNQRVTPDPAPSELLATLTALVDGTEPPAQENVCAQPTEEGGGVSQDEVSSIVSQDVSGDTDFFEDDDDLFGFDEGSESVVSDITADELTAMMVKFDQQGSNHVVDEKKESSHEPLPTKAAKVNAKSDDDLMTDDEFDRLLDEIHGPVVSCKDVTSESKVESKSESKVEILVPDQKKPALVVHKEEVVSTDKTKIIAPSKGAKPSGREQPTTETTVRVDTQRLDDIMNMVGELVLVRNRLVRLGVKSSDELMNKAVSNLDVVTADLQTAVMKTRMQPIKKVFGRFPRVVRDLARTLRKEISLDLVGEETDLDKNLVEALADPLVHLVRNAVDHGIEMPQDRQAKGKPREGTVLLSAEQEGDHILLTITDDGAGMDAQVLREKAVDKGLYDLDAANRLTDREAYDLIFAPGFSTKNAISDISGRGVGMDVVKTRINQLNGSIVIDSELGKGSKIIIKVPLTLAIMPTLMVMLGRQIFALPLNSVNEIFQFDSSSVNVVDGQEVITLRERAVPLFYLKRWLVKSNTDNVCATTVRQSTHVVIVSVGAQRVGFVVDQLVGQEEVVIKPLGSSLNGTPGMSGATITGDGRIALILDVPSMLSKYVVGNALAS